MPPAPTGITNYDEYSLVRDIMEEKKEEITGTLKKDKTLLRDEKKMEKLKQKLHTDDERECPDRAGGSRVRVWGGPFLGTCLSHLPQCPGSALGIPWFPGCAWLTPALPAVNWLDHGRTLREQGVDDSETLLLRRKFFYSDQNVDSRDPVQLNLLYVQVPPPPHPHWGPVPLTTACLQRQCSAATLAPSFPATPVQVQPSLCLPGNLSCPGWRSQQPPARAQPSPCCAAAPSATSPTSSTPAVGPWATRRGRYGEREHAPSFQARSGPACPGGSYLGIPHLLPQAREAHTPLLLCEAWPWPHMRSACRAAQPGHPLPSLSGCKAWRVLPREAGG